MRAGKGIENHAIAFYKAVKRSAEESKLYAERIADRQEYTRLYTDEQRAEFKMRRGYLIHEVEKTRKALFMSIESHLERRVISQVLEQHLGQSEIKKGKKSMEGKDADFPVNPENFTPIAVIVGGELVMLDGHKVEDLEVVEEDSEDLEQNEEVVNLIMNSPSLINMFLGMAREKLKPPEE